MDQQVAPPGSESKVVQLVFGERNMPEGIQEEDAAKFGDTPGHEFHGNQWTDGGGGGTTADGQASRMLKAISSGSQQQKVLKSKDEFNNLMKSLHTKLTEKGYGLTEHRTLGSASTTTSTYSKDSSSVNINTRSRSVEQNPMSTSYLNSRSEYVVLVRPRGNAKFGVVPPMLIQDAEIFHAGSWPGHGATGVTFSESDLDSIVASFGMLGLAGRVPLKLGHDGADARTTDGAPALGWVESVKRVGGKLLADIKLTSDKLAEGIRSGAYKFVSIELLRNVQAHTRQIPWVLDAVALLGATAPAVGTLRDLQTSMQSFKARRPALRGERLAFKRENTNHSNGDLNDMDEQQVQAAIAKAVKEATDATTARFTSELAVIKTKLDTSNDETAKARAQAHRFSVLAPIEAAIARGTLNAAAKDKFIQVNALGDDVKVLLTTPAMAETFVNDVKDMKSFKGPGAPKRTSAGSADDEVKFTTMTCAKVLTFCVDKEVLARGGDLKDFADLEAGNSRVLASNKHLALQYFNDPQALYEAPAVNEAA